MMADARAVQLQEEGVTVRARPKIETPCQTSCILCCIAGFLALAAAGVVLYVIADQHQQQGVPARAQAKIYTGCDNINGIAMGLMELEAEGDRTFLRCRLNGLPFGLHGLHVHKAANFTDGCTSTLGHYNPSGATHGGPLGPRHYADFGNIMGSFNQTCETEVLANVPLHEIVGHAFVVHMEKDDLGQGGDPGSRTTGNAGGRLAGGPIEWVN